MDPQAQTSFIPKKSLSTEKRSGGGVGIFYLISIFIFLVSLVAAGAAFAYTQYLKSTLASKSHSLELAQGAYEPGSIRDLTRLNQRITNAKTLLARHISPSAVFDLLSAETLEQVQFKEFSYAFADTGKVSIQLRGVANSFSAVALQSDQFGANKSLSSVVFSDITVDVLGKVNFSVSATMDTNALLYRNWIQQSSLSPEVPGGASDQTL
jgi:hypothetical protein